MKTKEELQAIREGQKRLSWIENVKKVYGWDQEVAEAAWDNIKIKSVINEQGKAQRTS